MIPRIAWIFALTVFTVSAQQQGDRLWIGNAAALTETGKIAPGSIAQYSITFETILGIGPFPAESPKLTLQQGTGPEIALEVLEGGSLSGQVYIPETAAPGPARVTLTSEDYSLSTSIDILPTSAALYSVDFSRILNAQLSPTNEAARLTRPARPGDTITLWGTGLGTATAADIEASIGDQPLQILYAGHSSQYRGLDQYNLAIPAGATLPETCYARLDLKVRGARTPVGYLPASNSATGPCRHELHLTTAQLTALDEGGTVPVASFSLSASIWPAIDSEAQNLDFTRIQRRDYAYASISPLSASEVAVNSNRQSREPGGQCTLDLTRSLQGALIGGNRNQQEPIPSLGDKVLLESPDRSWDLTLPPEERWFISLFYTATIPPTDSVRYVDQLPASAFSPGKYVFSGAGDETLPAFRLDTETPGAIRLRNSESLRSIDRSRDLTLAWETAWTQPADTVEISLGGSILLSQISCTARALDGSITIPATLLRQLPSAEVTAANSPILSIGVFRPASVRQLPRRNGADPVPAVTDWHSSAIIPVTLR